MMAICSFEIIFSSQSVKRIEKNPFSPADPTNDPAVSGENQCWRVETKKRSEPYRSRRASRSMIRHAFFGRCSPGCSSAQSVSALTIAMIVESFGSVLVSAARLALLLKTGSEATLMAAIAMPSVTMRTDEKHSAALGGRTKLLMEDGVLGRYHPGFERRSLDRGARGWQHSLAYKCVASASRRRK